MNERRIPVRMVDEPSPRPTRKTRLPVGSQWLHHETPGSRAAQRRLRQLAKRDNGGHRG